ncbi:glycoside hydrolase family 3 protein [Maribacter sp. 2307ULW6-5]|uniref:glycoside hydrolase family 3 protein n=1 Tax=Maribacter sp. 2307ULW6-5 TaxID=3386275 RepID=UPI0039BCDF75
MMESSLPPFEEANSTLGNKEKAGQLFMPAAFINDTEAQIRQLEALIRDHHVGGLCFFHSRASAATNFEGKKEVVRNESSLHTLKKLITRYQKTSKYPLLMAIDAEWGLAMRIENTPRYPYAITLGALQGQEQLIREVGQRIAQDCKWAGLHWNLSPVVDINTDANNPVIGYRAFGDDREAVAQKARAYVEGMQLEGVPCSIKHFPGHGDTATDSHLGLPVIKKAKTALVQHELYPFKELIANGVEAVMVGHLSVPALTQEPSVPSSINKDIIKGVLRKEMGFQGLVISDALNMHAVSKHYPKPGELEWLAFDAGNDILCFAEHVVEGINTIVNRSGPKQLQASFERIWRLKERVFVNRNSENGPVPIPGIKERVAQTDALNRKIAKEVLTLLTGSEAAIARFRENKVHTLDFRRKDGDTDAQIAAHLDQLLARAKNEEHLLLNLTPPRVKPNNDFGFTRAEIKGINALLQQKQVVLYHFGNPYALRLFKIRGTVATVLAYQEFEPFRAVAHEHYLGAIPAKGKLPITLAL